MPMPYTLTRGPLLTLLENVVNPTTDPERTRRDEILSDLRAGVALDRIVADRGPALQAVRIPGATADVRLREDWIGDPGATWTGYWVGYQGDVAAVLRRGLIRAIEASLGLSDGEPPGAASRSWPIQVDWKCPNPWFEVWVTWRRHAVEPSHGQVNVLIATPPDQANRLTTQPAVAPPPPAGVGPEPTAAPDRADGPQGMWVVAHERHEPHTVDQVLTSPGLDREEVRVDAAGSLVGLPSHLWAVPTPTTAWTDAGDVLVVSPPSYAGGADPGRTNAP